MLSGHTGHSGHPFTQEKNNKNQKHNFEQKYTFFNEGVSTVLFLFYLQIVDIGYMLNVL